MAASNGGTKFYHTLVSFAAALPLVVCLRDSMFSLCKVKGSSMEPTLKNGDILLIRKADFPILRRGRKSNIDEGLLDGVENGKLDKETRDRHLREYEYQHFMASEDSAVWARWPPWPSRGQVVTYRSPDKYPPDLCIKRVVAVAGQVVKTSDGLKDVSINSVWVEGDNPKMSTDSRDHGVLNQKLLVGVADFCVWPPSRIRRIETKADDNRAFWL